MALDPGSASGIALGAPAAETAPPIEAVTRLLPLIPTTRREFTTSERVQAFVRVFQGARSPLSAVTMHTEEMTDASDRVTFDRTATIASELFGARSSADHAVELPMDTLKHGPYLLTITARAPAGAPVRQEVLVVRFVHGQPALHRSRHGQSSNRHLHVNGRPTVGRRRNLEDPADEPGAFFEAEQA